MRFICKNIRLSIVIDDKLVAALCRLGYEYYPKEYGGLFVGRYVNGNREVIIERTVLPKDFKSSASSFERGIDGLRTILQGFFNQSPSLTYVGEWHTHPDGPAMPSSIDASALRTIALHHDVAIENPILLIIGVSKQLYELGFYVLYKDKILRYESEKKVSDVNAKSN